MYTSATIFLGISITLMVFFNGVLSSYTGEGNSLILIHLTGTVIILGIYLIFGRCKINLKGIPKLFLTTGILGVLIVLLDNYIIMKIGASVLVVLTIAGQLFFSLLVDSLGLFGREVYKIDTKKAISLALVAIGVGFMYLN